MTMNKQDNNMTNHTGMIYVELNCLDWLDGIRYIMKTKQENDMTDNAYVIIEEYYTKFSRPIE